jgi:UDP-glucuronate 4-epimerase
MARALLRRGEHVLGVDNVNDYYDVTLKEARLRQLAPDSRFTFVKADIADEAAMGDLFAAHPDIDRVVHLAAQAGVRYSLEHPLAYVHANIKGQVVLLEAARRLPRLDHFLYASSSSVYGGNDHMPFAVADRTDHPTSLYGASKKAGEVIAQSYASMYGLPLSGLRFFTVYGPWGRPDMAAFIFLRKIIAGEPLPIFGHGRLTRDFTFIDDIIEGAVACLDRPPADGGGNRHRLYNLGNDRPEGVLDLVRHLESALGRKAMLQMLPMQPGDVVATHADIGASRELLGFEPKTSLSQGIARFVAWYRDYYGLS